MGVVDVVVARSYKGIRSELISLYDGDEEAAMQAVDQLADNAEALAAWATRMLRSYVDYHGDIRTDPSVKPFSWDEVPEAERAAAARGMAIACLVSQRSLSQ